MRTLIGECVNPRVRRAFPNHEVVTVAEAGWRGMPDDRLVELAKGRFDVLVTIDQGFGFEHNLQKLTFGIVIVHVRKNRIGYYQPPFSSLLKAVETIRQGELVHVKT